MKNILFVYMFALLNLACAVTQSQSVESNPVPQNKQEKPAPSPPSIMDKIAPPQEPIRLPKAIGIPTPINDDDYVVAKLIENKMKKMTLDRQPQEIIEYILASYQQQSKDIYGTSLKKINTRIEDRDLNHDGIPERIIMARLFGDEEFPVLYIFKSENKKWSGFVHIELGSPNMSPHDGVEFLSKPDKSDFDLIKVFSNPVDAELSYINYYQMQNGKYELIDDTK